MIISRLLLPLVGLLPIVSAFGELEVHKRTRWDGSEPEVYEDLRRRLWDASRRNVVNVGNETVFEKSWTDHTVFRFVAKQELRRAEPEPPAEGEEDGATAEASVAFEVKCTYCYVAGTAGAYLSINGDVDVSQALDSVGQTVDNTIEEIKEWVGGIKISISDGIDIPPPSTIDFNVVPEGFPEIILDFFFQDFEIYADLETTFDAGITYTLPLFVKPLGVDLGENLFCGLSFSVDLIISLEGRLHITHGFHVKLDEGVNLKIAMFSDQETDFQFESGQFEFLPVQVESAGVVFQAVLRLSMRAGFAFELDLVPIDIEIDFLGFDSEDFKMAAGLETELYANIADFKSNISVATEGDCDLQIEHAFQFGIGAKFGAYVGLGEQTWGPTPSSQIDLFPTTFGRACLMPAEPTVAPRWPRIEGEQEIDPRQDLEEITLSTSFVMTARNCIEPGVIQCPAAAQHIQEMMTTQFFVTSAPPGVTPDWPQSVVNSIPSRVEFGNAAQGINSTPTSSSRHASATNNNDEDDDDESSVSETVAEVLDGETAGVDNKIIIGVSVGVGVPLLIGAIAGLILWKRRQNYKEEASGKGMVYVSVPHESKD